MILNEKVMQTQPKEVFVVGIVALINDKSIVFTLCLFLPLGNIWHPSLRCSYAF
jgi:hypothetical protein